MIFRCFAKNFDLSLKLIPPITLYSKDSVAERLYWFYFCFSVRQRELEYMSDFRLFRYSPNRFPHFLWYYNSRGNFSEPDSKYFAKSSRSLIILWWSESLLERMRLPWRSSRDCLKLCWHSCHESWPKLSQVWGPKTSFCMAGRIVALRYY